MISRDYTGGVYTKEEGGEFFPASVEEILEAIRGQGHFWETKQPVAFGFSMGPDGIILFDTILDKMFRFPWRWTAAVAEGAEQYPQYHHAVWADANEIGEFIGHVEGSDTICTK